MVHNISRLIRLPATRAPAAVLLIRLYVGVVFACEGVLKFLRPDALGPGRFEKAGIPAPSVFAYFDGVVEIACGVLILVGLLTRLAAAPMIVDMLGAVDNRDDHLHRTDAPLAGAGHRDRGVVGRPAGTDAGRAGARSRSRRTGRSIDVRFDDFMADEFGVAQRLDELAGEPLSAEARAVRSVCASLLNVTGITPR
jgi:uncharacterized membrane protein